MKGRAALVALVVTWSLPAVAAERVALLLPECELPGVTASELREAVALDLQPDGLVLAPPGELSPGRDVQVLVEATCPAPDELTLRAERGAERQRRTLRLSELASEQRPRALSLALTELVSLVLHPPPPLVEAAPEPKPEPAPAKPPELTKPSEPARVVAPPAPATITPEAELLSPSPTPVAWQVGLAPQARFFKATSLWGVRLQLSRGRFRFGAGYMTARSEAPAGSVSTSLTHSSAGYAFPLLGDPERTVLESGPRVGAGFTLMSARANEGGTAYDARDWYLDAAWTARFQAALSASLRLGLGAELGYGRGPIGYADDVVIARTSGPFLSVLVDVAYRFFPGS